MLQEIITGLKEDHEAITGHLETFRSILRENRKNPEISRLATEAIENLHALNKEIACSIQLYESILSKQRISSRNSESGESRNTQPG